MFFNLRSVCVRCTRRPLRRSHTAQVQWCDASDRKRAVYALHRMEFERACYNLHYSDYNCSLQSLYSGRLLVQVRRCFINWLAIYTLAVHKSVIQIPTLRVVLWALYFALHFSVFSKSSSLELESCLSLSLWSLSGREYQQNFFYSSDILHRRFFTEESSSIMKTLKFTPGTSIIGLRWSHPTAIKSERRFTGS